MFIEIAEALTAVIGLFGLGIIGVGIVKGASFIKDKFTFSYC